MWQKFEFPKLRKQIIATKEKAYTGDDSTGVEWGQEGWIEQENKQTRQIQQTKQNNNSMAKVKRQQCTLIRLMP